MEKERYKLTHYANHNDIELDILIGLFENTEENIQEIAQQEVQTVLLENALHIVHGDNHFVILIHEEEKYRFEMNFKPLNWNLEEAYKELKQLYPDKEAFAFSSVAYSIDKVN